MLMCSVHVQNRSMVPMGIKHVLRTCEHPASSSNLVDAITREPVVVWFTPSLVSWNCLGVQIATSWSFSRRAPKVPMVAHQAERLRGHVWCPINHDWAIWYDQFQNGNTCMVNSLGPSDIYLRKNGSKFFLYDLMNFFIPFQLLLDYLEL